MKNPNHPAVLRRKANESADVDAVRFRAGLEVWSTTRQIAARTRLSLPRVRRALKILKNLHRPEVKESVTHYGSLRHAPVWKLIL